MTRILVIEDDPVVRANLLELLVEEGYETLGANGGLEGIKRAWDFHPDLILCDILMPYLDGFKVLSVLSKEPQTATIPFIYLTARTDRDAIRLGMNLGADDYITKPYSRVDILSAIHKRLEKHHQMINQSRQEFNLLNQRLAVELPEQLISPLGLISNLAELLRDSTISLPVSQINQIGEDISNSIQQTTDSVHDYWSYNELENSLSSPELLMNLRLNYVNDLPRLITEMVTESANQAGREGDIEFDIPDASINISEVHLHKVVEVIAGLAMENSAARSTLRVTGMAAGEVYEISIQFQLLPGMGAELEKSFLMLQRSLYHEGETRLNLGFLLAQRIIQAYQGEPPRMVVEGEDRKLIIGFRVTPEERQTTDV